MSLRLAGWVLAAAAAHGSELSVALPSGPPTDPAGRDLSPSALVASPDGCTLYVACATDGRIAVVDLASRRVARSLQIPGRPAGLAVSPSGDHLYVVDSGSPSFVHVVEPQQGKTLARIPVGHSAQAPALGPDGRLLYVCNRFDHDLSVVDLAAGREIRRIPVLREPVAAAVAPDGRRLVVANHLHAGRADDGSPAAVISLIDASSGCTLKPISLPRGSGLVRGLALSPDGRYAAVTHILARYYFLPTELQRGRINANLLTLLDLNERRVVNTLSLDWPGRGAANPWAVIWTPDGQRLAVTHAGTHELSLIEAPAFIRGERVPCRRIALSGDGPRALAQVGSRLITANYFSDNLSVVDLDSPRLTAEPLELAPARAVSRARRGEALFNDARLCDQGWQSCASCHDSDARSDGLNWDLLNDGAGNPKNAKSLLWAPDTPPVMSLGVRANAEAAVRAGFRHLLFTEPSEDDCAAVHAYLQSLTPLPSPALRAGRLSQAAERGRAIFQDRRVGCARCHPPPWFTDLQAHQVGTAGVKDSPGDRFDTPALVELWRTSPYLHDGSAAAILEVLTSRNPGDRHGRTSHLAPAELADLAEYLLSL